MALYTRILILTNTAEEADAINAEQDTDDMYFEEYARPYGAHTNGIRFEALEIRYDGVRNSEYEKHVAQGLRYDLRRGFDN